MAKNTEDSVTMTMDDFNAMVKKLKEEVKAEMEAEANGVDAETSEADKLLREQIKEAESHLNDPVTIQLFKDGNKYKDDVFVSINDKNYLIQRGVPVTVPRIVAQVLQQSQEQDIAAAAYREAQQREYKEATIRLNL